MGWQDAPIVGQAAPATPAPESAPASWKDAPIVGEARNPKSDTMFGTVKDFVTGESKIQYPDVPNIDALQAHVPWGAVTGLMFATDNQQKLDILAKALPQAEFSQDKFGNPMMDVEGQTVYVNKPGLRPYDVAQGVGQAASFIGVNRLLAPAVGAIPGAASVGKALDSFPKIRAAIAGATTSAGMDLAANAAGAEKVIDAPRAGVNAAVGAGAEMLSPLAGRAYRSLSSVFQSRPFMDAAGNLTQEAAEVLTKAGIDPASVSDEFAATFARMARDAANPEDAARFAQAASLPVPVPQTRGTITGLPSDQMTESMAAKGVYGDEAQTIMRGRLAQQQDALRGNVSAIRQRLGGTVLERGQGGAAAQQGLLVAERATKDATKAAYDAAKDAPAAINPVDVSPLAERVKTGAGEFFPHSPKAQERAQALESFAENALDDASVKELFDWRRTTSSLKRATADPTESAALGGMIREFDAGIEQAVKESLKAGDEQSARLWSRAVAIRKGEGRRFQSDDLIGDLLEKEYAGGRQRLKIAPEQVSNYIFGASDMGFVSKPQLARELSRLRGRLGESSEGWRGIQEEAFMRFASQGESAMHGADRMFSGTNFKKSWDTAWSKNGPAMRVLFDDRSRRLIDEFAMVAARTTGKVPGGDNPSGTAVAMANIAKKLASVPFAGDKFGAAISLIGKIGDKAAAKQAIKQPMQMKQLPTGVAAGVVGAAANLTQGGGR